MRARSEVVIIVMGKRRRPHTYKQKGRYSVIIPPFLEVPLMNIK